MLGSACSGLRDVACARDCWYARRSGGIKLFGTVVLVVVALLAAAEVILRGC